MQHICSMYEYVRITMNLFKVIIINFLFTSAECYSINVPVNYHVYSIFGSQFGKFCFNHQDESSLISVIASYNYAGILASPLQLTSVAIVIFTLQCVVKTLK